MTSFKTKCPSITSNLQNHLLDYVLHKCKRHSKIQGTSQLGQSAVRQSLQRTMRVESTGTGFTGEICKHVATPSLERLAELNSSGPYLESLILSYQCLVVRLELLKNFFHLHERQHMQLNQVKCTNAATQYIRSCVAPSDSRLSPHYSRPRLVQFLVCSLGFVLEKPRLFCFLWPGQLPSICATCPVALSGIDTQTSHAAKTGQISVKLGQ